MYASLFHYIYNYIACNECIIFFFYFVHFNDAYM